MRKKKLAIFLIFCSILFLLFAVAMTFKQFQEFKQQPCNFPMKFEIGSIPVGGFSPEEAKERLKEIYEMPVSLQVGQSHIQVPIEDAGISFDWEEMLTPAMHVCQGQSSLSSFWGYLWNRGTFEFAEVPLKVNIDQTKLTDFINQEIKPRYQFLSSPAYAITGTTQFAAGAAGKMLDDEDIADRIFAAFQSIDQRTVIVEIKTVPAQPPSIEQIEYLLQANISDFEFPGIVEIYLEDLSTRQTSQLAMMAGNQVDPGIAFTAASTMKIPIMISTLWREDLPLEENVSGWLNYMIVLSENDPADRLMERIDPISGPLRVTSDMQAFGLENSFISGFFYLGAPLLSLNSTTANTRLDINTNPDLYNQTTAADIGALLAGLYDCAINGKGILVLQSDGKITAEKCQLMIDILARNQIGALAEAGLPEGTRIAHKHGWSEEDDGLLHTVSDVAIAFGPEKDFVFTIFVYSPQQLLFDDANYLIARLAQTAFNGLNPNHQIQWLFER